MFMGKTLTKDNFYIVLNRKQELSSKKIKTLSINACPRNWINAGF